MGPLKSNKLLLIQVDLLPNVRRKVIRHSSVRARLGTLNVIESTDDLVTSKLQGLIANPRRYLLNGTEAMESYMVRRLISESIRV